MTNKKAFTLIELIVATGILTVSVFGIYKLIYENIRIIDNSDKNTYGKFLFQPLEECINNSKIIGDNYFSFGDNLKACNISASPIITKIDNIEYIMFAKMINNEIWELRISGDYIGTLTGTFIQKK